MMSGRNRDGALFNSYDYQISFMRVFNVMPPLRDAHACISTYTRSAHGIASTHVMENTYIEIDPEHTHATGRHYPRADRVPIVLTLRGPEPMCLTRGLDAVVSPQVQTHGYAVEIPYIDGREGELASPARMEYLKAQFGRVYVLAWSLTMSRHERECVLAKRARNRAIVWLLTRDTGRIYAVNLTRAVPARTRRVRWFGGEPLCSSGTDIIVSVHKCAHTRMCHDIVRMWLLGDCHPLLQTIRVVGRVHCVYICDYGVIIAHGTTRCHRTTRVVHDAASCIDDIIWYKYDARWRRGCLPQTCRDPDEIGDS